MPLTFAPTEKPTTFHYDLTTEDLTLILQDLGVPVSLADLPFGQKTVQVIVHYIPPTGTANSPIPYHIAAMLANTHVQVVGTVDSTAPSIDADAVGTISMEFSLQTPFGAPFDFTTLSQRLPPEDLHSFAVANIYRFLAYAQLFHQTAYVCVQYGQVLSLASFNAARVWGVPNLITLILERYSFGSYIAYHGETGSVLDSSTLYVPTLDSPYLHPHTDTASSWEKYSKESTPRFFSKLTVHLEQALLNQLQC